MTKTLASGLVVEDTQYYKLLEWKDNNLVLFNNFCREFNFTTSSINKMSKAQYEALAIFANIK